MPHDDRSPHFDGLDDARKAISEKVITNNGLTPPGTSKEAADAAEEFVASGKNGEHVLAIAAMIEVAFALGLICEACAFKRGVIYGVLLQQQAGNQDKLDYQAIIDALNKDIDGGQK